MQNLKIRILSFLVGILVYTTAFALPLEWPTDGVIVEPDMSRDPLIAAFQDAKKSLKISAYKLTDEPIIAALEEVAKKGISVDILVTRSIFKREGETKSDETPLDRLKKAGITVHQSPEFYAQTHHKMILVDDTYALIGTGNMGSGSFDESKDRKAERDFWITVTNPAQIAELKTVFKADFDGKRTDLKHSLLVWSPDQGRTPFTNLIGSAKKSIWVYQQDIEDPEIATALAKAAKNGIDVRLMMMPNPFNKPKDGNIPNQEMIRQAGGKVGLITHVVGHAKAMLIDVGTPQAKVYLGSANFYPPSLDKNRELGIVISEKPAINTISSVFEADWRQADFTPREP